MISLSTRQAARSFRRKLSNVSHSVFLSQCHFCACWRTSRVSYLVQTVISRGYLCRRANVIFIFSSLIFQLGVSCNRLGQHSCLRCKVRRNLSLLQKAQWRELVVSTFWEHVYVLLRLHEAFLWKTKILSHITNCFHNKEEQPTSLHW